MKPASHGILISTANRRSNGETYSSHGKGTRVALVSLDGKETTLLDTGSAQWPTAMYPSPDGHYLGYGLRVYEGNVVLLENY